MFPHNLKIHLKTEHGVEEDPADTGDGVTCEHCQKSFKHASYLKYHLVIRHGIGTPEEKAKITAQSQRKKEQKIVNKRHKPMMTCKLCPYQTNDQYRLRTHTEVVHQGVKRHKYVSSLSFILILMYMLYKRALVTCCLRLYICNITF